MAQNPARNTAAKLMLQFLVLPERPANSKEGFLFIYSLAFVHSSHIVNQKKKVGKKQNKISKTCFTKKNISFILFYSTADWYIATQRLCKISFYLAEEKSRLKLSLRNIEYRTEKSSLRV